MASASHLIHHILHRRPPPSYPPLSPSSSSSLILNHLSFSSSKPCKTPPKRLTSLLSPHHRHSHSTAKSSTLFANRSLLFSHTLAVPSRLSPQPVDASSSLTMESELDEEDDEEDDDFDDFEEEEEEEKEIEVAELKEEGEKMDKEGLHSLRVRTNGMELPSLSVKEKKELSSYAHSLGKKLKSQLVGKSGFTSNVATSFVETLESNELLKIKVHKTCPGELEEVVKLMEELTCSVVISKIGRTVILYRPSLTKLKAEEKKRQYQKIFLKRKLQARSRFSARAAVGPRSTGRGKRGSSRFEAN